MEKYQAGICNIGHKERRKRFVIGIIGLIISIILFVLLYIYQVTAIWRLFLLIPLLISAIGFIQAKETFCVANGIMGIYNMDEGDLPISTEKEKKIDKIRAIRLTIIAIILAFVVALITVFISF